MFNAVIIYPVSNALNTPLIRISIAVITFNSLAWLCFWLRTIPSLLTAMEISRAPGLPSWPSEVTVAATDCPVPRQVAASDADRPGLQS